MEHKFLFIVTSAIIPFKQGSINTKEERYLQTLKTIESIREKVPNSHILMVETSEYKLSEDHRKVFLELTDDFVELYQDETLKKIYSNVHENPKTFDFAKSLLESVGIIGAFTYVGQKDLLKDFTRIFKISGRYYLNDDFNIIDYYSRCLIGNYVFSVVKFDPENKFEYFKDMMGIDGQLVTGLWSFCPSLMQEIFQIYTHCLAYIDWIIGIGNCIDIERCLYKFMDMKKIVNMRRLGVTQLHGPTGNVYQI